MKEVDLKVKQFWSSCAGRARLTLPSGPNTWVLQMDTMLGGVRTRLIIRSCCITSVWRPGPDAILKVEFMTKLSTSPNGVWPRPKLTLAMGMRQTRFLLSSAGPWLTSQPCPLLVQLQPPSFHQLQLCLSQRTRRPVGLMLPKILLVMNVMVMMKWLMISWLWRERPNVALLQLRSLSSLRGQARALGQFWLAKPKPWRRIRRRKLRGNWRRRGPDVMKTMTLVGLPEGSEEASRIVTVMEKAAQIASRVFA